MKIPKCPRTITGKHYFSEEAEYVISLKDRTRVIKPKCQLCGIIDDRKTLKN